MVALFAVSWDEVDLAHVESFLATAGDEGLTWEAKGGERPHPVSVRKSACGFANAIGGCLLIGVERQGDNWLASGVDFQGPEPNVWIDQIVRDGLRPVPKFGVKSWAVGTGHVAVIAVESVAIPPCMTAGGEVYERVSGRTVKVIDPTVLARLLERGMAVLGQAEAAALNQANRVRNSGAPPFLSVGLGLAPTGLSTDVSANLFTESFAELFRRVIGDLPSADHVEILVTQDGVHASTPSDAVRWVGRASWNSAVGLLFEISPRDEPELTRIHDEHLFVYRLRPAADALAVLARELGGYGRTHVALRVAARGFTLVGPPPGLREYPIPGPGAFLPIQRWSDDGSVSEDLLASMRREFLRACGARAWEPRA